MNEFDFATWAHGFLKILELREEICNSRSCVHCPLSSDNNPHGVTCSKFLLKYPKQFLSTIEEYAFQKDRPTWGEYLSGHSGEKIPDNIWRLLNDKQGA